MSQPIDFVTVPGKAAEGFDKGEEKRLALIAIDDERPRQERLDAIKRLRQIRGTRLPQNSVIQ